MPTTVLLDTFTAADGTDPIDRDMDAHPAGAARWVADGFSTGVIQGGSLRSVTGNLADDCYLLYQLPGGAQVFGQMPLAVVLKCKSFGNYTRLYAYNTLGSSEFILNYTGDQAELYCSNESAEFVEFFAPLVQDGVENAIAVWSDGEDFRLIINGAESASASAAIGPVSLNWLRLEIHTNGNVSNIDTISEFGIYTGITLAQAIALTSA